jgi:hypothetical protein
MSVFNKLDSGLAVAAILGATLAFVAPAFSANLVQNGDFENALNPYWTEVGTFSAYNGINSGEDGVVPYVGCCMLSLGNFPPGGPPGISGIAGVSQTLSTVSGRKYDLSLVWTDNGTNSSSQQLFEVLWNGLAVYTISGETGSLSWQTLSVVVTGTGSDTLTLEGYSDNGFNDVDNVSVAGIISATPLPSAWTMLIAGFVGLGCFAYRGMKKNSAAALAG